MFTGREDEIKEISNLMTEDSTRLVNIWGSPGFGKTSTAIEVAHHLSSLGYPVYFFKLQGITTIDELLSKILGIFKSNLVDVNLTPVDKIISIFREISSPVILILDNLDDLLSSEISSVKLQHLFVEFLDSNTNITIFFTTRELLENLRDQMKGFQDVRIRPLSPVSSIKFVRQLLPSFAENVVSEVAEISLHVPLAIRLVSSLIKSRSEEMANKVLKELQFPDNRLAHFENNIQKLFDKPYEQLPSTEKNALVSLIVFSSATISKNAAVDVVSGEQRVSLNALRSLETLVKKSLIDEDPNGEYYLIHPLIYSFIVLKAKEGDFQNVLNSANVSLCSYYLLLFERLNDDFLAGKSINNPQLEDVMQHLWTVMWQSVQNNFDNAQHLFRILSKAEMFLFLISISPNVSDNICKIFDFAIERSECESNDLTYLKLYVSNYFRNIALSLLCRTSYVGIPETIRKEIAQLSDGTASKLSCYEGIFNICNGNVQDGIKEIEISFGGLQSCPDHLLLKCLCLHVLTLYHNNKNELGKSCEFREIAINLCRETCNYNLLLTAECDCASKLSRTDGGEPLILFNYLLAKWSVKFWGEETKRYVCNFVSNLQQQIEREACGSRYSLQILFYGDFLVALLSFSTGQETFLDTRIEILRKSTENCISLTSKTLPNMSLQTVRLFACYSVKGSLTTAKDQSVEAYRKALDISLQKNGEKHIITAICYYNVGSAENAAGNYSCALKELDQALVLALSCDPDFLDLQVDIYKQKGITHHGLGNYELAIFSFQTALDVRREQIQENETISDILVFLSTSQVAVMDMTSALATAKRALDIRIKLFSEKRLHYLKVSESYQNVAAVHAALNNHTETVKCLEEALKMLNSVECEEECLYHKCVIYMMFVRLEINDNLYIELLDRSLRSLRVVKEGQKPLLALCYLIVCSKQLQSGKHKAGIASLHAALHIELGVSLRAHLVLLETVSCYINILGTLVRLRKSKFYRKIIKSVLKLTESLPKHMQSSSLFRCYFLQGVIHNQKQEYVSAIPFFEDALTKFCIEADDKRVEYACQKAVALAYYHERRYEDSLTSLYEAMSIIRDLDPGGSESQAEVFHMVACDARQLGNRKLTITNLRLAYKMYLKVLGQNHPKTEESYLEYVHALMN